MARTSPQERYEYDAQFRQLVDTLTSFIVNCQFSPSELREAAMLAAIRYEMIHARPSYIVSDNAIDRVDSYHGRKSEMNDADP
jgi:hypothetical protein